MNQTLPKTDLEKKVFEVLSHKNWGASSTVLNELARDTYDYEKYIVITKMMWEAMDGRPAAWRQVFKSLTLLEHLVKNGSDRVVEDARSHGHKIRSLYNFNYYEGTTDRGVGVREKAKQIMEVLQDNERIREERQKARQLREKFGGGMSGVGSSGGKYEGYGNDSFNTGGGYGNGGIGGGGGANSSLSRGYSGRYSDEQVGVKSRPTATSDQPTSPPSPHFASIPQQKSTKVKKTKKKKEKLESAPAAPEVDLFSFAPAPSSVVAPKTTADDSFDAFQGAATVEAPQGIGQVFDAFGKGDLSQQQVQPQNFDAFGSATLISNNTPQGFAMNHGKLMQQPMMLSNAQMIQHQIPPTNTNIMGGGKAQIMKAAVPPNDFGDFSTAPVSGNDDFGEFSGFGNGSKANTSAKVTGSNNDPMSRLIALDSLTPNKKNEINPLSAPIPPRVAPTHSPKVHSAFQVSAMPVPTTNSNPELAFSGIDGLNKPISHLMAPVPAKTAHGQQVMMQQNGPSVIDTMGMPSPTQTMNKGVGNQTQQMVFAQQMGQVPTTSFGMSGNNPGMNQMNMMYTPQQQAMMASMQMSNTGLQQMNPMMMNNMANIHMANTNTMNQQQGGFSMGGQSSDKNNMLGGQLMGDGGGFR